jgi:tRNA threonylcarbamoyl adenosine modification protein YjeE
VNGVVLDLAGVERLAADLADELAGGAVVWLDGPLGAGKTTLVRAFVARRTGFPGATSPTYGLVHRYPGPRGDTLHLDCYRLRDPEEAADLDWEAAAQADVLLIEWPGRAAAWAPPPTVRIDMEYHGDLTRRVTVTR